MYKFGKKRHPAAASRVVEWTRAWAGGTVVMGLNPVWSMKFFFSHFRSRTICILLGIYSVFLVLQPFEVTHYCLSFCSLHSTTDMAPYKLWATKGPQIIYNISALVRRSITKQVEPDIAHRMSFQLTS